MKSLSNARAACQTLTCIMRCAKRQVDSVSLSWHSCRQDKSMLLLTCALSWCSLQLSQVKVKHCFSEKHSLEGDNSSAA